MNHKARPLKKLPGFFLKKRSQSSKTLRMRISKYWAANGRFPELSYLSRLRTCSNST